ncbi:MAG: alpha/beta hydrolase [Microthrixaceae bacterium]
MSTTIDRSDEPAAERDAGARDPAPATTRTPVAPSADPPPAGAASRFDRTEGVARHGEVELHWESRNDSADETILLVMGLGAQMIAWREGFCDLLAEQGFRVVRFDNRDVGLSTMWDGDEPTRGDLVSLVAGRPRRRPDYLLADMADDAVAVLDAVGVERAHVVGASMGGMIAQQLAIDHPQCCRSLTSIMSRPGDRHSGLPTLRVLRAVLRPIPADPDAAIEAELTRTGTICGPLFDPVEQREFLTRAAARSARRDGLGRQLMAILGSPDRTPGLRRLTTPTLVIHGRRDGLVRLSGGLATAAAVEGSTLVVHDRMGHDLPRSLWGSVTDSIADHARRASAAHG